MMMDMFTKAKFLIVNNHFTSYFPVILIIVGVILVFTFGFKAVEQPPFDKLYQNDERTNSKSNTKKKQKNTSNTTTKKASNANGHIANSGENTEQKNVQSKDSKHHNSPIATANKTTTPTVVPSSKAHPQQQQQQPINKKTENKVKKETNNNANNANIEKKPTNITSPGKKPKNPVQQTTPPIVETDDWETVVSKSEKRKKPSTETATKVSPVKSSIDEVFPSNKNAKKTTPTKSSSPIANSNNNNNNNNTIDVKEQQTVIKADIVINNKKSKTTSDEPQIINEPQKPVDTNEANPVKKSTKKNKKPSNNSNNNEVNNEKPVQKENKMTVLEKEAIISIPGNTEKKQDGPAEEEIWMEAKSSRKNKKKPVRRDN